MIKMNTHFHLSIGVQSLEASLDFFVNLLQATVLHRDPSGYVNIDFFGTQITLKENPKVVANVPDFHFGANLSLTQFEQLSATILEKGRKFVLKEPQVHDAGTAIERKKMYLRCPTGYLIELKGYR